MTQNSIQVSCKFILVLYPPTLDPPFSMKVGIETMDNNLAAEGQLQITGCHTIQEGVEKSLLLLRRLGVDMDTNFALVYPMFQGMSEEDNVRIIDIAWQVKEVADQYNWQFARTIPQ